MGCFYFNLFLLYFIYFVGDLDARSVVNCNLHRNSFHCRDVMLCGVLTVLPFGQVFEASSQMSQVSDRASDEAAHSALEEVFFSRPLPSCLYRCLHCCLFCGLTALSLGIALSFFTAWYFMQVQD